MISYWTFHKRGLYFYVLYVHGHCLGRKKISLTINIALYSFLSPTVTNFIIRIWIYALTWQKLIPCIDRKGGRGVQTPRKILSQIHILNYSKLGLCLTSLGKSCLEPPSPHFTSPQKIEHWDWFICYTKAVDNCYM